jgi:hypothetical protein
MATLQNLGSRSGVPGVVIELVNAVFFSRVGRCQDSATHLNAARQLARELGDVNGEADADLVDAMLALERDQHARAIQHAERATGVAEGAQVDIMRARRLALAHLIAGVAEVRLGKMSAARTRLDRQRELDVAGDPIQGSWRRGLTAEIALAEGRVDDAEWGFRGAEYAPAIRSERAPSTRGSGNCGTVRTEIAEEAESAERLTERAQRGRDRRDVRS